MLKLPTLVLPLLLTASLPALAACPVKVPAGQLCIQWTNATTLANGQAFPVTDHGDSVLYHNGKAILYPGSAATQYQFKVPVGQCYYAGQDYFTVTNSSRVTKLVSKQSIPSYVQSTVCGQP